VRTKIEYKIYATLAPDWSSELRKKRVSGNQTEDLSYTYFAVPKAIA